MRIEKRHNTTKADAISIIDNDLRNLLREPLPAGLSIVDPKINWNDNVMNVSFNVRQSFIINVNIQGSVTVNNDLVIFDADIPRIIINIIGEGKIRNAITRYLNDMFD